MLLSHRESLETLTIGYLYNYTDDSILDVSDFTALKTLALCNFGFPGKVENVCSQMFSAPCLTHFKWVLPSDEELELFTGYDHFGHMEESWLRNVTKTIRKRGYPLHSIFLEYQPNSAGELASYEPTYIRMLPYPWDVLDVVASNLRREGVELTYESPYTSREEFRLDLNALREIHLEMEVLRAIGEG
jgi:hypothetical protein